MTSTTTLTKDGSLRVKLPKEMQQEWRAAKISVRVSSDTVVIQKTPQVAQKTFSEMLDEFQKTVKKTGITRKDVNDAVRWARRTKNESR